MATLLQKRDEVRTFAFNLYFDNPSELTTLDDRQISREVIFFREDLEKLELSTSIVSEMSKTLIWLHRQLPKDKRRIRYEFQQQSQQMIISPDIQKQYYDCCQYWASLDDERLKREFCVLINQRRVRVNLQPSQVSSLRFSWSGSSDPSALHFKKLEQSVGCRYSIPFFTLTEYQYWAVEQAMGTSRSDGVALPVSEHVRVLITKAVQLRGETYTTMRHEIVHAMDFYLNQRHDHNRMITEVLAFIGEIGPETIIDKRAFYELLKRQVGRYAKSHSQWGEKFYELEVKHFVTHLAELSELYSLKEMYTFLFHCPRLEDFYRLYVLTVFWGKLW